MSSLDDAAAGIRTWERADEVIARSRVVVVDRPGNHVVLDPTIDWIRVEVPRLNADGTPDSTFDGDGLVITDINPVRLVAIGEDGSVDLQPCGGTHVRSTGEIGQVRVEKIEKKGKQNRRVRLALIQEGTPS